MSAARPLLRYSLAVSAWRPNATTSTKQTSSRRSVRLPCPPGSGLLCPARGVFTASPNDAIGVPLGVKRSSGSRVRLPSKMTLLKLALRLAFVPHTRLLIRDAYRPWLHLPHDRRLTCSAPLLGMTIRTRTALMFHARWSFLRDRVATSPCPARGRDGRPLCTACRVRALPRPLPSLLPRRCPSSCHRARR